MAALRDEILEWAGSHPTMARTLSAAAKLDRIEDQSTVVRFAIIRNITVEPGLPGALKLRAARAGLAASVALGKFDAAQEEVFDADSFLYAANPHVIIVAMHLQMLVPGLMLRFSSLAPNDVEQLAAAAVDRVVTLARAIRARSSALILINNFSLPIGAPAGILEAQSARGQLNTIRAMNVELTSRLAALDAAYVVDIDYQLSLAGYETSLDDRYWHIGRAPYSFGLIERLADEYVKFAAALLGKSKKCLVLDCDNTLWGGVIGEDGINGIALGETNPGSAFVEFQSALLELTSRGILLAINSKNNPDDVLEVFRSHPNSILRPEHFVCMKINWRDKAANLREIASELNVGLDSMVFMDDSAFECRRVREELPEVTVVELPSDPSRFARLIRRFGLFDTLSQSSEDSGRTEMYRSEVRRGELKRDAGSMDEYLQSLEMVLTISKASAFSIPRLAQLTQKTNQFNLTTKRYSDYEIGRMAADDAFRVYGVELEDVFGRAGIIAVAIVQDEGPIARIDSLLMSCRVIGRGVEQALLEHVAVEARELGRLGLVGEYIATTKNSLAANFYASAGFAPRGGESARLWEWSFENGMPSRPKWFKAIRSPAQALSR